MPLLAAIPAALALFNKQGKPQPQPVSNSAVTGLLVAVSITVAAGIAGFLIFQAMDKNKRRKK